MTDREYLIYRNVLKSLQGADGLLVLEAHLREDVAMATPHLRATEFRAALTNVEDAGRVTSVAGDRGVQYKINDAGRAWLIEQQIA